MAGVDRRAILGGIALVMTIMGCAQEKMSAKAAPVADSPASPDPMIVGELAPGGRLKVAINLGNVVLAQKGGPRGATGPSVDIADELGRRLGVPVDLLIYPAAGDVVSKLATDKWDIGFMAIDPKRAEQIAFTAPYVYIDGTYMVRDAAPYHSVRDLDVAGRTIAVGKGAAYDLYLSRALKNATLVRADTSIEAVRMFENDARIDTVAGVREALVQEAQKSSGYRVLPDAFNRIEQAVAVPRGRDAGTAWVAHVVEQLKASGFIRKALDDAGQSAQVADPAAK